MWKTCYLTVGRTCDLCLKFSESQELFVHDGFNREELRVIDHVTTGFPQGGEY